MLDYKSISTASPFDVTYVLPSVDSTNKYLHQKVIENTHNSFACLADMQTAGRGRYGKKWEAGQGNICLSVAVRLEKIEEASALSLAVGVMLAHFLASQYRITGIQLKWPNDLLYAGSKLAGILVELIAHPPYAIVGIGLNVCMEQSNYIEQPIASMNAIINNQIDINLLAMTLLDHLHENLNIFKQKGFAAFKDSWAALNAFKQKEVLIWKNYLKDNKEVVMRGVCAGVDDAGGLLISSDKGISSITDSRLSVRLS